MDLFSPGVIQWICMADGSFTENEGVSRLRIALTKLRLPRRPGAWRSFLSRNGRVIGEKGFSAFALAKAAAP